MSLSNVQSESGVPLFELRPSSTSPNPQLNSTLKRKRNAAVGIEKNAVSKKLKHQAVPADADLDLVSGINYAIGRMDNRILADHVAQQIKRLGGDLSLVELEDRYIPEKAIQDTSAWENLRDLKNLPDFLERYSTKSGKKKNLSAASKAKGAPHTIVVAAAGLRAADLARTLRVFQNKDSTVAKLFAKHIKLKDAIEHVKKTRMGIAVGTPTRLIDLLTEGALSIEKLERVVIDCSHIDQKKRGILDMRETQLPLVQLLSRDNISRRYGTSDEGIRLLFY
ncbi:MAG: hypothetical protein M1812_005513 [Candelaria pacifica]|nr:MAG: hypothetical protein M1812_005513 [Candelaria pacifica]